MFGHETISPNNIQANGVAEAVVKIMKCLWHKCRASSEDPLIELLNIRKSLTEGLKSSKETIWQVNQGIVLSKRKQIMPHYPYSAKEATRKEEAVTSGFG